MTISSRLMPDDISIEELLSANIRMIMGLKGFNKNELIIKSEVSRPTITVLLSNQSKGIQFSTIDKIAKALGVQPIELFQIR
ncbi:helix-turn-helix domain-containing protein [Secundilactobacillus similis]|uniref:helix-turn-helix domain-containing protein n=1 Tax=Secundilactobacillus similis TaxID=414682 RepID=UPI0006CF7A48|nr:helix-turn-helix transcriptional regulator [Secundilactobacillus similis]